MWIFLLFQLLWLCFSKNPPPCGSDCSVDTDCIRDNPLSPCSFCSNNVCISLCGIGCRDSTQCQNGGSNPCISCSPNTRTCVNPNPLCGSFCPNNVACLINGSGSSKCGQCDMKTNSCSATNSSICGKICGGQNQCAADPRCSQCVSFYCAPPAKCGQVCIGSGLCQLNPGKCHACIGAVCENTRGCGGACGNDNWCGPSCPVCGFAKCVSRRQWDQTLFEYKDKMDSLIFNRKLLQLQVINASNMQNAKRFNIMKQNE